MKKLFWWALAAVALNVLVYQMCVAIWGHNTAATAAILITVTVAIVTVAIVTAIAFVAFTAAAFAVFAAFVAITTAIVFTAFAFTVAFAVAFAFAFALAAVFAKEENLPYWRVMTVLLGEAGAIISWMLIGQHSLPLAAGTLAAGVGIMVLATFVGVPEPENKAAAVGQ